MAPVEDETIWFAGENGVVQCVDRSLITPSMMRRFKDGTLKRSNDDGTPWIGQEAEWWLPRMPEEMIIGTLRGYRYWSVDDDGRLTSHGDFRWPVRGWAEAVCRYCKVVPGRQACQDYGYGCGLYAANTATREIRVNHSTWGVLEAKGRIVSHRRGFRAQYARPIALAVPDAKEYRGRAALAAQRYNVPVLPIEALLGEYAPDLADHQSR